MKKYFDVLRKCRLFYEIADEHMFAMLGCIGGKVKAYQKEETILAEGDPAGELGIVLSGAVQIVRIDYYGNRSIVASMEPSQLFGESFSCAEIRTLPVNVVAAADTEVMFLDARRITGTCGNACSFHRQLIFNLLKAVAVQNLLFHQKIEIISKRSTREKLMTYLLFEAKRQGSDSFTIPYDRQELADYLEVDRSGLSAEISKMRKEGKLESRRNYFKLFHLEN